MTKTLKLLQEIYEKNLTNEEAEKKFFEIERAELVDFILWHFNRGKFDMNAKVG